MNKNTEQLIKELEETKSILNSFLAKRVKKDAEKNVYGYNDFLEEEKLEKKLYQLFLSRIDPTDRDELLKIDKEIKSIEDVIFKKTGWYRIDNGFMYETNFVNQHDPEFASQDTYRIIRTEEGYTYDKKEPFNSYFAERQKREKEFCEEFKDELERMHKLLTDKETIMNGGYKLKNERERDLLKYISIYLGFKEKRVVNEKQEHRVKTL